MGGVHRTFPLCRWRGRPPASGKASDTGDAAFEASRGTALAQLREIVEGVRSREDRVASLQRIHRARYGEGVEAVPLNELADRWEAMPRRRRPSAQHVRNMRAILERFTRYVQENARRTRSLDQIPARTVLDFLADEERRGLSGRTLNVIRGVLRTALARLAPASPAALCLAEVPGREELTAHRRPWTPAELRRIFGAAEEIDPALYPAIVCAATTALRRGDVCHLTWDAINLEGGFVTVKTTKTRQTVDVPILPPLRPVLEAAAANRSESRYVWPHLAELADTNPGALTWRLERVIAHAGLIDDGGGDQEADSLPILAPAETRERGLAAVDGVEGWNEERRERARVIVTRYLEGEKVGDIAREVGCGLSTITRDIAAVQAAAGVQIVRHRAAGSKVRRSGPTAEGDFGPRARRASLSGWHAFRTTWATIAISCGIPAEIVRAVTGHAQVETVVQHYFRPRPQTLMATITGPMGRALLDEGDDPAGEG